MKCWSWLSLLVVMTVSYALEIKATTNSVNNSTSTHLVITLKAPLDPPKDFKPVTILHQQASIMAKHIPKSSIVYMFDNFATYFNIYMFSIQLHKSEDLAIIGKLFSKEIKSVEEVTSFVASELVTDVRNLAHGLPYRQVLNRPFRDLNELSGERSEIQDVTCTIADELIEEILQPVQWGVSMGLPDKKYETSSEADYEFNSMEREEKESDSPVTVYVLDTGIQANHAWFEPDQVSCGYDFERTLEGIEQDKEDDENITCEDPNGHGTQIAGIIGGHSPQTRNVSRSSDLVSVRVLNSNGVGWTDDVLAGMDYVVGAYFTAKKKNPRTADYPLKHLSSILHLSLSGRASNDLKIIINAVSKVMPVVGASGDDDSFSCWTTPADSKSAIVVGASMQTSNLPISGSNFGECISMNAPGDRVPAPYIGESNVEERMITGSSASAARVTALLVNVLTIMETDQNLYNAFNNQIAEEDVSVFLKAVITEAVSSGSKSKWDKSHAEVHKEAYTPCAIDSHDLIRRKLAIRLTKTISKALASDASPVQYDENAPRGDSPTKRLRDRFNELKKKGKVKD